MTPHKEPATTVDGVTVATLQASPPGEVARLFADGASVPPTAVVAISALTLATMLQRYQLAGASGVAEQVNAHRRAAVTAALGRR